MRTHEPHERCRIVNCSRPEQCATIALCNLHHLTKHELYIICRCVRYAKHAILRTPKKKAFVGTKPKIISRRHAERLCFLLIFCYPLFFCHCNAALTSSSVKPSRFMSHNGFSLYSYCVYTSLPSMSFDVTTLCVASVVPLSLATLPVLNH